MLQLNYRDMTLDSDVRTHLVDEFRQVVQAFRKSRPQFLRRASGDDAKSLFFRQFCE